MKGIISFIVFAMIVFITFGLPSSFFFVSTVLLEAVLIITGIVVLLFWALFLVELFERIGGKRD